jgi:hypothetical protein
MLSNFVLYAGVLPLVASAAIAFVLRWLNCPARLTWPAAIAGGIVVARFAVQSQTGVGNALQSLFQPHEAIDWLPLVVLLVLGVSILMHLTRPQRRRRVLALAAGLSFAVPVRLLSGNVRVTHWSLPEKAAYLSSLAVILASIWFLLSTEVDEKETTVRVPLVILLAVGTAITVIQSGALIYGLTAAAVAASISGAALAFLLPEDRWDGGAIPIRGYRGISGAAGVLTFSLGSLILLGHFYAELSAVNAALLFLSLAATAAPLPAAIRGGPVWRQLVVRSAACLVPLGIAVVNSSI